MTASLGFLLGIVWLDLIFDVRAALGSRSDARQREAALAAVSAYYRHATGAPLGMAYLIAVVIAATLASIVVQLIGSSTPNWVSWSSFVAAGTPIVLALTNTVPCAIKLGAAAPDQRGPLARRVLRDHVFAVAGLALALLLQLVFGG